MSTPRWMRLLALLLAFSVVAAACGSDEEADESSTTESEDTEAGDGDEMSDTDEMSETEDGGDELSEEGGVDASDLTIGMILVGPEDDRGWSQAHREGGEYAAAQTGAELLVIDKVNTADRPETTVDQVAADLIDQGADIVFATSDDMKEGILAAAEANPDVPMIWSSGDSAWADGNAYRDDLENLGNIMGRMEDGKMMAGCAAALESESGTIGFLGPLINDETRRLVNAAYLGARECWERKGGDPADLSFEVQWIGFWFNIPGVTLDPTLVANEFFDGGVDVLISGIDTTEALVVAGQRAEAGEAVKAVPYDYVGACDEAPEICLGVPYFNWGPAYADVVSSVADGSYAAEWQWIGPDYADINNVDSSAIGFQFGDGLTDDNAAELQGFIDGLADGSVALFTGPLNFQDGSEYLADGEAATDQQIWYTPQLLDGIDGASEAS